jgi:hypothetical protein
MLGDPSRTQTIACPHSEEVMHSMCVASFPVRVRKVHPACVRVGVRVCESVMSPSRVVCCGGIHKHLRSRGVLFIPIPVIPIITTQNLSTAHARLTPQRGGTSTVAVL